MKKLSLYLLLLASSAFAQQWRTAYYFQGAAGILPISNAPFSKYTHVTQASVEASSSCGVDGTSQSISPNASQFVAAVHNAGAKALVTIANDNGMVTTCTTPAQIAQFVSAISNFINTYGYDGFDIDWESGTVDSQFQDLVRRLRATMPSKLITVAVTAANRYTISPVQSQLDQVNIMNYDKDVAYYTGQWATDTWYNSATLAGGDTDHATAETEVQYFLSAGIAANKIGIGLPFYARIKQGCRAGFLSGSTCLQNVTAPAQPYASGNATTNSRTAINYSDLLNSAYWSSGTKTWDATHGAQYVLYNAGGSNQAFVPYTGPEQIQATVNYVKNSNLGGIMTFELSGEYISTAVGDARYPLSSALSNAMGGGATAPVIMTVSPLASDTVGFPYSTTVSATGSVPIAWSLASGALPAGLQLNSSTGSITGTPTAAGNSTFTVQASNSVGSNTKTFSISVNAIGSAPSITTTSPLTSGKVNTSYSITLSSNGTAPFTWAISNGALPSGLSLNSSTGVIGGTPTTAGTSTFTAQASNGWGTANVTLSMTVNPNSTLTPYAYWTLNDGGGSTAADFSGNNHTATLLNQPSWITGSNCLSAACLSFNGLNQYGSTTLDLSGTSAVTLSFWMNWTSYANDDRLAMEFTSNFNDSSSGFMVDPNSSAAGGGQFEVGLQGDAGYNQVVFARPTPGWHHYTFIFNKAAAAQAIPYVDGIAVPYTQITTSINTNNFGTDSLYFMSRGGASLFGNGALDEVQLYTQVLSDSQILTLAKMYTPPSSDTTAPTAPSSLAAVAMSSSQINLSWSQSTDDVGVVGYRIYLNGGTTPVATVTGTTYQSTGLAQSTTYSYTVAAYDLAGNTSSQSARASAVTQTVRRHRRF